MEPEIGQSRAFVKNSKGEWVPEDNPLVQWSSGPKPAAAIEAKQIVPFVLKPDPVLESFARVSELYQVSKIAKALSLSPDEPKQKRAEDMARAVRLREQITGEKLGYE